MQAGALRHRVELQAPAEIRDDIGGVTQIWIAMGEVWANIEPLTGKEVYEASSLEGRLSHRITLRWLPILEPTWRLVWKDQTRAFQIYSVRDVQERHRQVQVLAMEIVN
jgi:SPP1 family predicted phage head-tail adaptor